MFYELLNSLNSSLEYIRTSKFMSDIKGIWETTNFGKSFHYYGYHSYENHDKLEGIGPYNSLY